jgi:hypothetical protein|tara:strand:- start:22 stop:327 length:306 start_codon:yes stop_codon:yes gene_type:complete
MPFNKSPIKMQIFEGEENYIHRPPQKLFHGRNLSTSKMMHQTQSNFGSRLSMGSSKKSSHIASGAKFRNHTSMTGYKTFYESNDYHIINQKGKNNFHVMSV